ncbi:hypothetical protein [Pseudoflavonifractor phocaeensis]|uniref:hypothetical protein n=1 Tax=Pseudoflavonifractor phocaeensis TaxID=1870988 RepID=UPI0019591561|nr:hypothetical protein [Pseudoflavonifractor phocaeensis]MBM6725069.1 hypothetical protein [Pseudoflavonifractor phocaeensis]
MKSKWDTLSRLFPLGWPWQKEITAAACALALSALTALTLFAYRFGEALDSLYYGTGPERQLVQGAMVPSYPQVLGNAFLAFGLMALCLVLLPIAHFLFHRQGARSDYLMRRLPQRWELARRCLGGSALLLAGTVLTAAVLFGLFFICYLAFTPAGCLPPDVWATTGG